MPRSLSCSLVLVAVLSATACFEFADRTATNPDPTITMLGGTWTSQTPSTASLLSSCTGFQWHATQKSETVLAGNFTAVCFQVFQVTGSVQATFSGSTITWTATGTANNACIIALAGTGTMSATQMTLTYTGDTCQGPVAGTEILVKT